MNRSIFFFWNNFKFKNFKNKIILNFGPQHPAAHGVLRLILQLNNELIENMDIHIGLLHRGTENLIKSRNYEKSIPYFDRLDYVSMLNQEHAYCITVEKLLNINNNYIYINYLRILFDELTRILNHMLAIACHGLDIGSMSSIFWAFEEREKIMEFYERLSGARMHASYHKFTNIFNYNIDNNLLIDINIFIKLCFKTLNEMHNVLTYNKIWKKRLINIATFNIKDCQNYGITGVLSRSVGLKYDLRLSYIKTYSNYNLLNFKSFLGINGDSYDRYLIRMFEMGESLQIINQINSKLLNLNNNNININNKNYNIDLKKNYNYMENLIFQFLNWNTGFIVKKQINKFYIESAKGEFGCLIIANNSCKPQKCKIRSPSYHNLQFLSKITKGHFLADLSAIIGTIDIVFGEIDR